MNMFFIFDLFDAPRPYPTQAPGPSVSSFFLPFFVFCSVVLHFTIELNQPLYTLLNHDEI